MKSCNNCAYKKYKLPSGCMLYEFKNVGVCGNWEWKHTISAFAALFVAGIAVYGYFVWSITSC